MTPDFLSRQKALKNIMDNAEISCALVTASEDIYYYTGIAIPESEKAVMLMRAKEKPLLFLSPLLEGFVSSGNSEVRFDLSARNIKKEIPEGRLGIDESRLSVGTARRLRKKGVRLVAFSSEIKEQRMIKDEWELTMLRKAARLTERIIEETGIIGKRESEIAGEIEAAIIMSGARPSFLPIAASARNSALIHYIPGNRTVREKDLVIIDCGAMVSGYRADITRTFCSRPGKRERKLFEDCIEIQNEIVDSIEDGVKFSDVQKSFEKAMERRGYKAMHGFGHGIGLETHERPSGRDVIRNGTVLTVEPGIYVKGFGGVRIEDMFIVRKKARRITKPEKELLG